MQKGINSQLLFKKNPTKKKKKVSKNRKQSNWKTTVVQTDVVNTFSTWFQHVTWYYCIKFRTIKNNFYFLKLYSVVSQGQTSKNFRKIGKFLPISCLRKCAVKYLSFWSNPNLKYYNSYKRPGNFSTLGTFAGDFYLSWNNQDH